MIRRPALILALLTGLNLLNYLDRLLVGAVGPSMSRELGLSDSQFGLISSAFLWGYMLASPVIGHLAARLPRKRLVASGIALWSAATSASGLARSFATLWTIRALVGIGEASYASISPAILDDITPPERRGRVLAIFYAAIPVGSALGYVAGGFLDAHVGWREAFIFCGIPGILLAALTLAIHDPGRSKRDAPNAREDEAQPPLRTVLASLTRSRVYLWTLGGYIAQTFALGGFSNWAPMYMERVYRVPNDTANYTLGGILVATGFVGSFLGGALADRLPGRDRSRVALFICAASAAVATPFAFWCVFAPSPFVFYATIAVAELGIFTSVSPVNGLFLSSVPPAMRTMAMGTSILMSHLLGDVISSPLVGVISEAQHSLTAGMTILPIAIAVCAAAWSIGVAVEGRAAHR